MFIETNQDGNPVTDHQFHLYRYFIIRTSNQTTLYDQLSSKEAMVIDYLKAVRERKRVDFTYWQASNILFYEGSQEDRLFYFKYAKELKRQKKIDGGSDVVEVPDAELRTAWVIFDTKHQFVLIQSKTTEFNNTRQVKNAIEDFLSDEFRPKNYTIKIDEMPQRDEFWRFVAEHKDHLSGLALTFNAPNLFFGDRDTRDALRIIKEETNNDATKVEVTSKANQLTIGENVRRYIEYIFDVGGEYLVKAKQGGRWVYLSSRKAITSLYLKNEVDEAAMKDLAERLDDVDKREG